MLESEPGVLIGTVDMAHIKSEREKHPYLRDRNQDMYATIKTLCSGRVP